LIFMDKKPEISVIMLTYNREAFVARAIESVLAQTYRDFEFIIVNNGSTDKSGAIADEYAAKDSRIRVIHRERGNIGSGRNTGLSAAKGEYIAFFDDDDWCEPDFLEFMHNLARESNADVSICGAFDKIFEEKCVYTAEEALSVLFWRRRFNAQFPTKLIRRKLFDNVRFSNTAKYDDIELTPRILASANRVAYHGLPKYTFYRHSNNNSAWTANHTLLNADILDEYLRAYSERTIMLSERFPNRAAEWRYFRWSFMVSMVEKIDRLKIKGCEKHLGAMTNELRENREEFLDGGLALEFEKKWIEEYIK